MNVFEQYQIAVQYLEGLSNLPIETISRRKRPPTFQLERTRCFLKLLGYRDRDFHFIHITGTAGKGTVTTLLHEILFAAGKRVGSFTSPFVTTSIEKIKVNDSYISPGEFCEIVEYLKFYIDWMYLKSPYGKPTYFEIFLAIALMYFKRKGCHWVILEVGAGGRYDQTNVIQKPVVTAITNIDYDHTHILGNTLQEIAYHKAGIIKKGSVFYTNEQRAQLLAMFRDTCERIGARFHHVARQQNYQEDNRALATAIAMNLGIANKHIRKGVKKAHLQCRFEIMQNKPLIILDGAHNRVKIKSTVENVRGLSFRRLCLVFGVADNKDTSSLLEQIIPLADHVFITRFQIKDRKCAHPKALFRKSKNYLKRRARLELFLDPEQAFAKALNVARADDLVLVTGSFFLAGEIRKQWYPEQVILQKRKNF